MRQNLKIGFDAKRAFHNASGLGNYSRTLIAALHRYFPQNKYVLFTPEISQIEIPTMEIITASGSFFKSFWRSFQIPRQLKQAHIDIYHGLSAELPFASRKSKTKYVVTIHDLIFLRFPELYSAIDRKIYTLKTRYACGRADRIIAISEQTKRDLIHYLGIDEQKIIVVYQTCDASFERKVSAEEQTKVRQRYALPPAYILTVGTIERRKNTLLILESMKISKIDLPLVLVGRATSYKAELVAFAQQNNLIHRLIFLHDAEFNDFPALYQMAKCFIYPSMFEGFGIPILEATKSNIPVIAATGSSLQEAGGQNIVSVDPHDAVALAKALEHILSDNNSEAIKQAFEYSKTFNQQRFAADTMAVYQSL